MFDKLIMWVGAPIGRRETAPAVSLAAWEWSWLLVSAVSTTSARGSTERPTFWIGRRGSALSLHAIGSLARAGGALAITPGGNGSVIRETRRWANGVVRSSRRPCVRLTAATVSRGMAACARCTTRAGDGMARQSSRRAASGRDAKRTTVTSFSGYRIILSPVGAVFSSTVSSWSGRWGGCSNRMSLFITRTACGTTTGSRIWSCGRRVTRLVAAWKIGSRLRSRFCGGIGRSCSRPSRRFPGWRERASLQVGDWFRAS